MVYHKILISNTYTYIVLIAGIILGGHSLKLDTSASVIIYRIFPQSEVELAGHAFTLLLFSLSLLLILFYTSHLLTL
jgi:hypothetical protein